MAKYLVIIRGAQDSSPEGVSRVKEKLRTNLSMPEAEVERLFSKLPAVVREEKESARAEKLKAVLESFGAKIELKTEEPEKTPPPKPPEQPAEAHSAAAPVASPGVSMEELLKRLDFEPDGPSTLAPPPKPSAQAPAGTGGVSLDELMSKLAIEEESEPAVKHETPMKPPTQQTIPITEGISLEDSAEAPASPAPPAKKNAPIVELETLANELAFEMESSAPEKLPSQPPVPPPPPPPAHSETADLDFSLAPESPAADDKFDKLLDTEDEKKPEKPAPVALEMDVPAAEEEDDFSLAPDTEAPPPKLVEAKHRELADLLVEPEEPKGEKPAKAKAEKPKEKPTPPPPPPAPPRKVEKPDVVHEDDEDEDFADDDAVSVNAPETPPETVYVRPRAPRKKVPFWVIGVGIIMVLIGLISLMRRSGSSSSQTTISGDILSALLQEQEQMTKNNRVEIPGANEPAQVLRSWTVINDNPRIVINAEERENFFDLRQVEIAMPEPRKLSVQEMIGGARPLPWLKKFVATGKASLPSYSPTIVVTEGTRNMMTKIDGLCYMEDPEGALRFFATLTIETAIPEKSEPFVARWVLSNESRLAEKAKAEFEKYKSVEGGLLRRFDSKTILVYLTGDLVFRPVVPAGELPAVQATRIPKSRGAEKPARPAPPATTPTL